MGGVYPHWMIQTTNESITTLFYDVTMNLASLLTCPKSLDCIRAFNSSAHACVDQCNGSWTL